MRHQLATILTIALASAIMSSPGLAASRVHYPLSAAQVNGEAKKMAACVDQQLANLSNHHGPFTLRSSYTSAKHPAVIGGSYDNAATLVYAAFYASPADAKAAQKTGLPPGAAGKEEGYLVQENMRVFFKGTNRNLAGQADSAASFCVHYWTLGRL